jgi:hypothetical protein
MKRIATLACAALLAAVSVTAADAASDKRQARKLPPPVPQASVDTVGSVVYDRHGVAHNRITGQTYGGCVIDDGYGRVASCDSGMPK